MLEYSICQEQPWVCTSLPRILVTEYGNMLALFFFLCALTAGLAVIAIPFIKRSKRKHHPLLTFLILWIALLLSPVVMLQLTLAQKGVPLTSNIAKCILLDAPNDCYTFAAVTAAQHRRLDDVSFDTPFSICNLISESEKCQVQVCDYIQVEDITTSRVERLSLIGEDEASRTAQLKEVQKSCWEQVARVCPDGNILENVPCGCYSPELGRYAVHSKYWYEEYWEKYRKMDPKPFCCNGEKSTSQCR